MILALLLAFLPAQTVTGAWSGVLVIKHDRQAHEEPIHVVLKQGDGVVTGTAGPDTDRQFPIKNGKLANKDGIQISFEMTASGVHHAFSLKLIDGSLKGEAGLEGEDGQPATASVELKPAGR